MSHAASPPLLLDDLPLTVEEGLWPGLRELSTQIAELLPLLPATSPVLLSGDWGAGKTTLLLAVKRRLEARDPPSPAIWFDAWRYEGSGPLLPALMRCVWEAAPPMVRADEGARGLFRKLFNAAVAVGIRAAPTVLTMAGVGVVPELLKGVTAYTAAGELAALGSGTSAEPPEDPTAALWRAFEALLKRAWPDQVPVIVVDDLDRCSPAGAVDLLDHLRVLVTGASGLGCKFLVAMDRGVLVQAIGAKFTGITGYDGNRYLEKVFPIVFTLPVPVDKDVPFLVSSFLNPGGASAAQRDDHVDALSSVLKDPVFANPRLMKRCINRYRMVIAFEQRSRSPVLRNAAEAAAEDRTLAKWIAATERFGQLRRLIAQQGDEFWREAEEALTRPEGRTLSPDVDRLVKDEAIPWVRREIFGGGAARLAQLRAADRRLRRWGL